MPECIKEKCRHWQRANHKGCTLIKVLEKECLETGEFQHIKPVVKSVEWENMGQFSILDLARIGICDEAIRDFMAGRVLATITTLYSATDHIDELTNLDILGALEINGFVRMVRPKVKPGDCIRTDCGVLMVIEPPTPSGDAPCSFIYVADTNGSVLLTTESYLSSGTRVEAVWQDCDFICKKDA